MKTVLVCFIWIAIIPFLAFVSLAAVTAPINAPLMGFVFEFSGRSWIANDFDQDDLNKMEVVND